MVISKYILSIICVILVNSLDAKTFIPSDIPMLLNELEKTELNSERFKLLTEIAWQYSKVNILVSKKYWNTANTIKSSNLDTRILLKFYHTRQVIALAQLDGEIIEKYINKISSIAQKSDNPSIKARAYLYISQIIHDSGSKTSYKKWLDLASINIQYVSDSILIAKHLMLKGDYIGYYENNIDSALIFLDEALKIGKRNGDLSELLYSHEAMMSYHYLAGNYNLSKKSLKVGTEYARLYGDNLAEIFLHTTYFKLTSEAISYKSAREKHKYITLRLDKTDNLYLKLYFLANFLRVLVDNSMYEFALEQASKYVDLIYSKPHGFIEVMYENFYFSYFLLLEAIDSDKLLFWYRLSQNFNYNKTVNARLNSGIANWYDSRGVYDSAYIYSKLAYKDRDKTSKNYQSFITVQYAKYLTLNYKTNTALKLLEGEIRNTELKNNFGNSVKANAKIEIAKILSEEDPHKHSSRIIAEIEDAIVEIEKSNNPVWKSKCYDDIAKIYETLTAFASAIEMLDSSTSNYGKAKIIDLRFKGELLNNKALSKKNYLELSNKRKQKFIQLQKYKTQKTFLYILASIVLSFSIYFLLRIYYSKKLKKLKFDLEMERKSLKDKELSNEMDRIRKDLHDEIGSSLSSLSIQSNNIAQKLNDPKIQSLVLNFGKEANSVSRVLSDYVWAMDPQNRQFLLIIERITFFGCVITDKKDGLFVVEKYTIAKNIILDSNVGTNYLQMIRSFMNICAEIHGFNGFWLSYQANSTTINSKIEVRYENKLDTNLQDDFFLFSNSIKSKILDISLSFNRDNIIEFEALVPFTIDDTLS